MTKGIQVRKAVVAAIAAITAFAVLAPFAPGASAASNYTQTRYAGSDRFDTAALIAGAIAEATPTAVLARADIFPDALTGAFAAAANDDGPLLLTRSDAVPPRTMQALQDENVDNVILLGGTAAINSSVETQLTAAGYNVSRIAGPTRYHTAIEIAEQGAAIIGTIDGQRSALISNGLNFPDALAGAPLSFAAGLPSLLTPPNLAAASDQGVFNATVDAMNRLNINQVYILGGPAAVSQQVEDELRNRGFGTTRLAGANRSGTSVEIFEFGLDKDVYTNRRFGVARGDAFPDALAYGPLGGRPRTSPAPQSGVADTGGDSNGLLLAASHCTLSNEVENFIIANNQTWTQGEILGGPNAICEQVAQQVRAAALTDPVAAEADVALSPTSGPSGSQVTVTYTGDRPANITDVSSSNCTITNEGTQTQNRTFTLSGNTDTACTITTTVSYTDTEGGTDTFTDTFTVTAPAGNATATARPELVNAEIISTTPTLQATATNPAGTVVRYTFDEAVTGRAPNPLLFHVYRFNDPNNPESGTALCGAGNNENCATNVSGQPNSVDVLFETLTNDPNQPAASTADLSVATVDLGAVSDGTLTNPEGDAAIGTGDQTLRASGRTQAPDLLTVSGYRGVTGSTTSAAVDFTFDQVAYVHDPTGFRLVLTDGTEATCTGPATNTNNTTNPGGGNAPGGNGTQTITAVCTAPTGGAFANQTLVGGTNVARGTVDEDTVGTTPPTGVTVNTVVGANCTEPGSVTTTFCNPLQASDTPDVESATNGVPDLVSVTFQPGTTGQASSPDQVLYTFDEPVLASPIDGTDFAVYLTDGTERVGGSALAPVTNCAAGFESTTCAAPQRNPSNHAQVLVTFPNGTLEDATGGNVEDGGVQAAAAGNRTNEQDEEGATNVSGGTTAPAGRTTGPDLIAVTLSSTTSGFGANWTATYSFDEPVVLGGANPGDFFLHLADGSRMECTSGLTVGANSTSTPNNSQVTCSDFTFVDTVGAPPVDESGTNTGAATEAQIGAATAGTVNNGVVTDAGTNQNPEGYEVTTGGTGTATA